MFTICNDGSCENDPSECPADADVTEADTEEPNDVVEPADTKEPAETKEPEDVTEKDEGPACDGQWENCCKDGKVDQCCCPEGVACNFGMYKDCGDGICVNFVEELCPGEEADVVEPPKDVEPKDTNNGCDGNWEKCCKDGVIGECCCPPNTECNYGWYEDCGDNICAEPGQCEGEPSKDVEEPPADTAEECIGNWETCCMQGKIDKCCCPEGAACNFGWFTKCSDTTCTGPGQDCPDQPEKEPPKEE
jgi:hypothetical protein